MVGWPEEHTEVGHVLPGGRYGYFNEPGVTSSDLALYLVGDLAGGGATVWRRDNSFSVLKRCAEALCAERSLPVTYDNSVQLVPFPLQSGR